MSSSSSCMAGGVPPGVGCRSTRTGAQTFWLRDTKIVRGEAHGRYGTALEAAGLLG